jgi:hypothetical protein
MTESFWLPVCKPAIGTLLFLGFSISIKIPSIISVLHHDGFGICQNCFSGLLARKNHPHNCRSHDFFLGWDERSVQLGADADYVTHFFSFFRNPTWKMESSTGLTIRTKKLYTFIFFFRKSGSTVLLSC